MAKEQKKQKKQVSTNTCRECGDPIKAMIFRGSGFCSVDCRKGRPKGSTQNGSDYVHG